MKRSLQLNPDNRPATWEQVKHWRDAHEGAPVDTLHGAFDADDRSERRMSDAHNFFDDIPKNEDGTITWKRADNTFIDLTGPQLLGVYVEVMEKRAARAALLHRKAEEFRLQDPKPTPAQLSRLSFWID